MLTTLAVVVVLYVGYGALLYVFQRQMLFPGWKKPPEPIAQTYSGKVLRIELHTSFGVVESYFMPAPGEKNNPTVIYSHGNYQLAANCIDQLAGYPALGYNVLIVEFPGYGRSDGEPSQATVTETLVEAYDWLVAEEISPPGAVLGHGSSIGGGAICALAAERPLAAMILQSTFVSVNSFAKNYLMPHYLVRDPFESKEVVGLFERPILFLHGDRDNIVPISHAYELREAAKNGTMKIYNAGHNDMPVFEQQYWDDISEFLGDVGSR